MAVTVQGDRMRPWIKQHTCRLDDVRLLRLGDRTQLRYWQLYLLAGRLNADGCFVEKGQQLSNDDLIIKLRVKDVKLFIADMKELKNAKLINVNGHGPYIADFKEEQVDWNKKQKDDRIRQQRKRSAPVTRDENVTDGKSRVSHAPRSRRRIEEDKEGGLINIEAEQKSKAPRASSVKTSKEPKAFANLRKVKTDGN
jgi:hypothetical protein